MPNELLHLATSRGCGFGLDNFRHCAVQIQTLEAGARMLLRRESRSLRGALAHFLQDGNRLSFGPVKDCRDHIFRCSKMLKGHIIDHSLMLSMFSSCWSVTWVLGHYWPWGHSRRGSQVLGQLQPVAGTCPLETSISTYCEKNVKMGVSGHIC